MKDAVHRTLQAADIARIRPSGFTRKTTWHAPSMSISEAPNTDTRYRRILWAALGVNITMTVRNPQRGAAADPDDGGPPAALASVGYCPPSMISFASPSS
jgi:hypothetical protein